MEKWPFIRDFFFFFCKWTYRWCNLSTAVRLWTKPVGCGNNLRSNKTKGRNAAPWSCNRFVCRTWSSGTRWTAADDRWLALWVLQKYKSMFTAGFKDAITKLFTMQSGNIAQLALATEHQLMHMPVVIFLWWSWISYCSKINDFHINSFILDAFIYFVLYCPSNSQVAWYYVLPNVWKSGSVDSNTL